MILSHEGRELCLTTTTLKQNWRSDFGKMYDKELVQVEVQKLGEKLLEFLEEDLENIKSYLFDCLSSDDEKKQVATIYILSSVEKEKETSQCLNRIYL